MLDLILRKNEDLLKDVKVRSNPNCSGHEMVEFLEEEQGNKQTVFVVFGRKKEKNINKTFLMVRMSLASQSHRVCRTTNSV